ncbi:MAG: hypothetical protein Q9197_002661 [Variospora fuerteventurae]
MPRSTPLITEQTGDIFSAPTSSILLHACNTRGHWGRGVAAAFKRFSPAAYALQHHHCTTLPLPSSTPLAVHQRSLVGKCLLIPPKEDMSKRFWIACLFTSHGYGKKGIDKPEMILEATGKAVRDLGAQIEAYRAGEEKKEGEMGSCWSVRINSGLFGVEWERTREVLEGCGVEMVVVRPKGEEGGGKKVTVGVGAKTKTGVGGRKRKEREEAGDEGGEKQQTRLKFGKGK